MIIGKKEYTYKS